MFVMFKTGGWVAEERYIEGLEMGGVAMIHINLNKFLEVLEVQCWSRHINPGCVL